VCKCSSSGVSAPWVQCGSAAIRHDVQQLLMPYAVWLTCVDCLACCRLGRGAGARCSVEVPRGSL
jgi:hypothetical protein